MDEKNVSFGEIVVGLRRKRGLTQYALAKKIRKDKRWVNLIEHGKNIPRPAGLILFARALDVEPADLFGMLADRLENRDRTVKPCSTPSEPRANKTASVRMNWRAG